MKKKFELYQEIKTLIDKENVKKGSHGIILLTPLFKENTYTIEFIINNKHIIKDYDIDEIESL